MRPNTTEDFWRRLGHPLPDEGDECWLWPGAVDRGGYGAFRLRMTQWQTHRLAWFLTFGEIPVHLQACHSCDVNYDRADKTYRRCCRPSHLYLGTLQENNEHKMALGRAMLPEQHPHGERMGKSAKLTDAQVRAIRAGYKGEYGEIRRLAREYGVHFSTIGTVIHRTQWKRVI